MEFSELPVVLLLSLLIKGTSAEFCYNTFYEETYECENGCCGELYHPDYGCCPVSLLVVAIIFGAMFFLSFLGVVLLICCKYKMQRTVANHNQQNTNTPTQPSPFQPRVPLNVPPPSYPGPPSRGSVFQTESQQPGMFPPGNQQGMFPPLTQNYSAFPSQKY